MNSTAYHLVAGDEKPVEVQDPQMGSETVLLVEDDEQVRNLTRAMLARYGYHVLPAAGPEEAEHIAQSHAATIDLLLTDVVMPGMNGPDLAVRLLRVRPEMKVVFMSGYTGANVVQERILSADTEFVQKPFTAESLNRKLREILEGPGQAL